MCAFKSDDCVPDAVSAKSEPLYHSDALDALDALDAPDRPTCSSHTKIETQPNGSPRPFDADTERSRPIVWLGVDTLFRIGHD